MKAARLTLWALAAAVVIVAAVVAAAWQRPAATATAALAPIPEPVRSATRILAAPGKVEPRSQAIELAVGLIGALKAVYVKEGEPIRRGQLLAELDNADQQARVVAATATVRLREAERDKLEHGARPEVREETRAQLDEAAAALALARSEYQRRAPLVRSGAASRQAMDQARSALDAAEARHLARAAAVALVNAPPRAEDVAIAEANLALAQANLAEQSALLAKTQLRSPLDGVVLRRYLQPGEVISLQPLTPILEIADTTRLRIRAEIDESEVGRIAPGQRATVTAEAYPGQRFHGVVARVAPRLGRKRVFTDEPSEKIDTQVLEVLIDLDQRARLPIGLRVDVFVEPQATAAN
jgi:HlyD family secretion protein